MAARATRWAERRTRRGNGFTHVGGGSVFFQEREELETIVQETERVHARVRGPHPGERLRHLADGFFNSPRSDGASAGRDGACAISVREEHEHGDGVTLDVEQIGPAAHGGAETFPAGVPGTGRGGLAI